MQGLNHIDKNNNPTMVDVSDKIVGHRLAKAQTTLTLPDTVWEHFDGEDFVTKKGPILHTAIIAGTMAVKKTHDLIPFCHPLILDSVKISITPLDKKLIIDCEVKCYGKTGVEMEALTGSTVSALVIYDMCKAISHEITIGDTKLIEKTGGKRTIKEGVYIEK
ncbi:MAG: cyclic pyranopterin monophosphate synthase MoaC [Halobacteriovoraceae bacterium]|nr:cyclic pyranopterin monophosphate synthase MoaC [Halobacteriovoraceae bacterium]